MLHPVQRLRKYRQLLVGTCLLLAFSGLACSANEAGEPASPTEPTSPTESATSELVVDVPASELQRTASDGASAYQQTILEDGRITFPEYETAVLRMVECAAASGARLSTGTLKLQANDVFFLAFAWEPTAAASASQAVDVCGAEYLSIVGDIWSKARLGITPQSTYDDSRQWFWDCIEESGIDMEGLTRSPASVPDVWARPGGLESFQKCQDGVLDQFGVAGFAG